MSDHQEHHDDGHHVNYFKIYIILLVLLVISVVGPIVADVIREVTGVAWVATLLTLVTAFGIAVYKAKLVIENFMHLKWEKRIMKWMLTTSLLLMALMFAGISPDVMNHEGYNWRNVAAEAAVAPVAQRAARRGILTSQPKMPIQNISIQRLLPIIHAG